MARVDGRLHPFTMTKQSSRRLQRWPVKNRQGKVLGYVKSLTIHRSAKQVVYATLVLRRTRHLMRLPWDRFEFLGDQLYLSSATVLLEGPQSPS